MQLNFYGLQFDFFQIYFRKPKKKKPMLYDIYSHCWMLFLFILIN